jgi:hypothetical protein
MVDALAQYAGLAHDPGAEGVREATAHHAHHDENGDRDDKPETER